MARRFGKKNEVKIDPLKYNICLLGEPKIGKTTLIKEVCEKLAGEEGYIFLEMNGEAGADAIEGIVYEDCDEWADVEDIVEDIIDSGRTLSHLLEIFRKRNPKSIKLCTLLDKPDRRVVDDVNVDYVGFQIPDEFVVGYGLDYDQKYRNLPYIGVVKFD